jgi:hypothetical protein
MNTQTRLRRMGGTLYSIRMTPRQRRRFVKKAGRDPLAIVIRDDGMGYSLAKQGLREVVEIMTAEAVTEAL